jgi:hypothetical protein
MRAIRVEGLMYSTVSVVGRTIPLTIGDRQVSMQVRRCNEDESIDPIRLSIRTSTTENLPKPRRAEGCNIQTRQIPGGHRVITIELSAHRIHDLTIAERPDTRSDAQIWPAIVDLLDELLPEYCFE